MSSPFFVPAVWGQVVPRAAKRGAFPFAVLASLSLLPGSPSAQAQSRIEGQILVRTSALAPAVAASSETATVSSAATVQRVKAAIQTQLSVKLPGASVRQNYDQVGWTLVKVPQGTSTDAVLNNLKATLGADNVVADKRLRAYATPKDTYYSYQWWLPKISAPAAWDITTGSSSVVVAVIDTGAQLSHPDLKSSLWVNSGEIPGNGKDDDGNGYIDDVNGINVVDGEQNTPPEDDSGHGTFCAGAIGAQTNNSVGVAGVNWNVKVMPLRFLNGADGTGYLSSAVECFNYAIAMKKRGVNIKVTSNSWGPDADTIGGGDDPALKSAFRRAGEAGIINIVAAGNGDSKNIGVNIDATPLYPASYDDSSIVTVAASDENDNLGTFSNYGATAVDLAAPGVRTFGLDFNSSYAYYSGTSMATPIVAGAAALLLSKEDGLGVAQIKDRILNTVDKVPQLSGKTVTGGRLNLYRMLTGAANSLPTISGQAYRTLLDSHVGIATVKVTLKSGNKTVATTTTASDGTYSFPNLKAGTYKITPTYSGYKFATQTVTFGGSDITVDLPGISTKKSYILSGKAVGYDNVPRANVDIYLISTKGSEKLATTDSNGNYVVYDRHSGTYRLTATGLNLEWFADPTAIKLPNKGAGAPNGIVNFRGLLPDTEAPIITIPSPANNSSVKVASAPKVSVLATDRSGVDRLYYTLTNTTSGSLSFYNWKSKKWTTESLEAGVVFDKDTKGTPVNLSVTLPKLPAGRYTFQVWGRDDKGNTTLAGNETTLNLFAGSTSTNASSVKGS